MGAFALSGNGRDLDGSPAEIRPSKRLFLTRVLSDFQGRPAETWISIINPNLHPVEVRLSRFGPDSQSGANASREVTVTIEPNRNLTGPLREVLGVEGLASGGYLRVDALQGDGVVSFQWLRLANGETTLVLPARDAVLPSGRDWLAPHVMNGTELFTNLQIVNAGSQEVSFQFHIAFQGGGELSSNPLTLDPSQFVELDLRDIFDLGPENRIGSVQLRTTSSRARLLADAVLGDRVGLRYASSAAFLSQPFSEAVMGHVAVTPEIFTGLAIHNPDRTRRVEIIIEVYDGDGALTGTRVLDFGKNERRSRLLRELVPEIGMQQGGSIRIRSSHPIVAQQLFGDFQQTYLSAVPVQVIAR